MKGTQFLLRIHRRAQGIGAQGVGAQGIGGQGYDWTFRLGNVRTTSFGWKNAFECKSEALSVNTVLHLLNAKRGLIQTGSDARFFYTWLYNDLIFATRPDISLDDRELTLASPALTCMQPNIQSASDLQLPHYLQQMTLATLLCMKDTPLSLELQRQILGFMPLKEIESPFDYRAQFKAYQP